MFIRCFSIVFMFIHGPLGLSSVLHSPLCLSVVSIVLYVYPLFLHGPLCLSIVSPLSSMFVRISPLSSMFIHGPLGLSSVLHSPLCLSLVSL